MTTRVLYVLANAHPGGAEKATISMARGHDGRRYAATLLFLADGPLVPACAAAGLDVELHAAPLRLSRPLQLARAIGRVRDVVRGRGIHLVHSCMPYSHIVAAPAASAAGVPACWFQHGPVGGRLDQLASLLPTRQVLANSAFTAGRHEATTWRKHPLVVVPLGTELVGTEAESLARWRREIDGRHGLSPELLVLGIIARFDPGKGIDFALASLAPLLRRDERLRVLVVGDTFRGFHPATKDAIHALVRREGLTSRVIFAGEQIDVRPHLARMDIVVSPSLQPEAFGMVVIEAMAFGKPVVASALGATPELVEAGSTGLLFDGGDGAALCSQVATLVEQPELRDRMGRNARSAADRRFSLASFVQRLELAYQGALAPFR